MLNNGWTRDGLIRYNSFVQFVKNERKLVARKEYEEKILAYKKRKKETKDIDINNKKGEMPAIVPYVDSSTDKESGDDDSDEVINSRTTGEEIGQAEAESHENTHAESESEDDSDASDNQEEIDDDYQEERAQETVSKIRSAPKNTSRNNSRIRGENNTSRRSVKIVHRRGRARRS